MKFNKFIYSKYYNLIKYSVFFIFFIFIIYEINSNFNFVKSKLITQFPILLIIIIAHILHHNILSLRIYFVLRICTNFVGTYIQWLKIYFESLIFNILISHTGSVYRAAELKKKNVAYKEFIGVYYISYLSYLIMNLFLVLMEVLLIKNVSQEFKLITFGTFISIFLIGFLVPIFSIYVIKYFKRFKLVFFEKITYNLNFIFLFIKKSFFTLKTIIILIIFGILSHFFEILLFYLSYDLFISDFKIEIMILLFTVSFLLDRIPIFSNIPGVTETIFAGIGIPFGLFFHEGFLIKLLLRITGYVSICFNFIFSYISNSNKKLQQW
jgi:hypothetical protein